MVNAENRLPPPDPFYPYSQPSDPSEPQPGYGVNLGAPNTTTTAPTPLILYTNPSGGAMLYEHGNYRWLQPSEVAAAENYVKTNGGSVSAVDDAKWAELVKSQQGAGSSGMSTRTVPVGSASSMRNFDAGKLSDLGHQTPKYVFARIASQFNTTDPEQRRLMLEMLRADPSGYFRNATLVGDKLTIGGALDPAFEGINQFDVFGGSKAGEWTPAWQPTGGPGWVPDTTASATAAATLPNVPIPTLAAPPSNYGASPVFDPVNPYSGMSQEAYRLLQVPAPTPMSTLALPQPVKR